MFTSLVDLCPRTTTYARSTTHDARLCIDACHDTSDLSTLASFYSCSCSSVFHHQSGRLSVLVLSSDSSPRKDGRSDSWMASNVHASPANLCFCISFTLLSSTPISIVPIVVVRFYVLLRFAMLAIDVMFPAFNQMNVTYKNRIDIIITSSTS